uniref:Uncharacterized protein n=1 Tax=Glossina brevipalpis TaxID=37001 RepID=A0A1A9WQD9_9MUSC
MEDMSIKFKKGISSRNDAKKNMYPNSHKPLQKKWTVWVGEPHLLQLTRAKWRREEKLRTQRRPAHNVGSSGRTNTETPSNSGPISSNVTNSVLGSVVDNNSSSHTPNSTSGNATNSEAAAATAAAIVTASSNTSANVIEGTDSGATHPNSVSPPLQAVAPRLPLNAGFNTMYSSIPQPIATMAENYNFEDSTISVTSSLSSMSTSCLHQRDSYPYMFHDPLSLGSAYVAHTRPSCNPSAAHQPSAQHAVYGSTASASGNNAENQSFTGVLSAGVSVPVQIPPQNTGEINGTNYWSRLHKPAIPAHCNDVSAKTANTVGLSLCDTNIEIGNSAATLLAAELTGAAVGCYSSTHPKLNLTTDDRSVLSSLMLNTSPQQYQHPANHTSSRTINTS